MYYSVNDDPCQHKTPATSAKNLFDPWPYWWQCCVLERFDKVDYLKRDSDG